MVNTLILVNNLLFFSLLNVDIFTSSEFTSVCHLQDIITFLEGFRVRVGSFVHLKHNV